MAATCAGKCKYDPRMPHAGASLSRRCVWGGWVGAGLGRGVVWVWGGRHDGIPFGDPKCHAAQGCHTVYWLTLYQSKSAASDL